MSSADRFKGIVNDSCIYRSAVFGRAVNAYGQIMHERSMRVRWRCASGIDKQVWESEADDENGSKRDWDT